MYSIDVESIIHRLEKYQLMMFKQKKLLLLFLYFLRLMDKVLLSIFTKIFIENLIFMVSHTIFQIMLYLPQAKTSKKTI